ncbi:MAG: ATP-binding protein [Nannocystaceae bacterium]
MCEIEGADVPVSPELASALRTSIPHLVRDAVDHGIEAIGARGSKPGVAKITIRASWSAEGLRVSVADDGMGIDPEALRDAAVAGGLFERERADALQDSAVMGLVFHDHFSLARRVTKVSGRGVGMASVRAIVEAVGGGVGIVSRLGEGATVTLSFPDGVAGCGDGEEGQDPSVARDSGGSGASSTCAPSPSDDALDLQIILVAGPEAPERAVLALATAMTAAASGCNVALLFYDAGCQMDRSVCTRSSPRRGVRLGRRAAVCARRAGRGARGLLVLYR